MPRSFLVKKHSSNRIPNYGQLETQKEMNGSCHTCGGLVFPLLLPDRPPAPGPCDAARVWDRNSVIARISLPLPPAAEMGGAPSPGPLEISLVDTMAGRAPSTPLKDSLNHLNLPPHLGLPKRRPLDPEPESEGAPEKWLGTGEGPGGEALGSLGRFECFDCHKSYHTFSGLAKHRQLRCELQARRYFSCKYCDKEYVSLGALKMHIRTHTLPCICKICGKAFSRPWLLQGHIRTHTGEKPYACSHCNRAFADRSNLRAHLQTHSDIKKYQCKSCAKTFSRMSLLARHEEAGCCPTS
ncbi:zinc finger protein SNAI3 [Ornithorhynchus anatinus]|uniref:Zinc finger protein SNAI2 n=1 Tax=Ornithorhynchus anatinus TaxID=9258 RepID=F6U2U6_ORNAN|nr:zinc finger protein SNAI3 [Ornithorhynchus anatinus]